MQEVDPGDDRRHAGRVQPNFFKRFDLEPLRAFTPRELEAAGRLTQPLYAGPIDRRYRVITWEEAMMRIGARMRATDPGESFFYTSGRSSNEAGFLLQLLARIYGTNNVNNCSFYCHQASGVGLASVTGSGTATVELGDLEGLGKGDVVFLIGANPASNHPRLMTSLAHFKRRGGRVIVVNPLLETGLVRFKVPSDMRSLFFGSKIADEYVQPHIGGDIAFLSGVAKRVVELGAVDEGFVSGNAEGFEEFRQTVESRSIGTSSSSAQGCPGTPSTGSPRSMPRRPTPCSVGQWGSPTTSTGCATSRRSPTWR